MKSHSAEPIRNKYDVKAVEEYLKKRSKRNYVIWVLEVNSGLRVSDIVGLNVSDVTNKSHITLVEQKTRKRKSFYINDKLQKVLKKYTKGRNPSEPLFIGQQGNRLNRKIVYRFIVNACKRMKINVKASTHTMRKTFGYHHYQQFKDPIILQKIFNHSCQSITLMYIGVTQDEIDSSYRNFEL